MKIPQVIFVKHCPNLSPERKVFLKKHLEERVPIKDVRWMEDYNHEDAFVEWLNSALKLPYGLKLTSNIVKVIMSWKMMIDENIESAILIDDDVVFHKDWVSIFESLPDIDPECFLNLGISPFFEIKPEMGKIYNIHNNGGCEGMWNSLTFVKQIMNNLNIHEAIDIVLHGHAFSMNKPLLCVPLCHQTSMLEKNVTLDHETRKQNDFLKYVQNYASLPKLNVNNIFNEFEKYKEQKKRLEEKFLELYGKSVHMKQYEYIVREGEYKVDILKF